jgi:hydrogenase expression/formation protein HypD
MGEMRRAISREDVERRGEDRRRYAARLEPLDLLQSIVLLLRQLEAGEAKVENQYKRVVPWEGNHATLKVMAEVFELRPYFEWRGLG